MVRAFKASQAMSRAGRNTCRGEFPWCCTDSRLIFKVRSIKKHHEAWYNKYILYWLDRERSNMIVTITRKDLMDLGYGPSFSRDIIRERSEEHTSELQSRCHLVCRLLL